MEKNSENLIASEKLAKKKKKKKTKNKNKKKKKNLTRKFVRQLTYTHIL